MKKKIKKTSWSISVVTTLIFTMMLVLPVPKISAEDAKAPEIVRYEGYSRDNVAENVAKAHFSDSKKVILVNREKFPDAISATNISQGRYPVLYTHQGHVTEGTMELLQSMPLDEIYVLGGTLSVNESVVQELENITKVTRIAGRSRYDANASAIKANFNQKNHVVIASGEVYSDALYGVSYANTIDAPVILTKTNRLEPSTIELLKKLGTTQATIIGGNLTVTPEVESQLNGLGISHERIAGRNRYIGSAEVANASYKNPNHIVVASGEVFSDALISAPLAQKLNAPILLVKANNLEQSVIRYIKEKQNSTENIYIQGGPLTISETVVNKITGVESVVTTEEEVVTERVNYQTFRRPTEDLYENEERVVQKGSEGERKKGYKVTYKNGLEVSRELVSDNVTLEPIDHIVDYGVKIREVNVENIDHELFNQEMLSLVNEFRRSEGVNELKYNYDLQSGANTRAIDIQEHFSHTRPDGTSFITAFGFEEPNYYLGENIAGNHIFYEDIRKDKEGIKTIERTLAEKVFKQYYNSEGHRNNMISENYNYFTTAITIVDGNYIYNVQIFDTRHR